MADEITINASLKLVNGELSDELKVNSVLADMAGSVTEAGVQAIGYATYEQLTINADMGTRGWACFKNVGTSPIEIGLEFGTYFLPFARLEIGEAALFRLAATDYFAQADTSGSHLQKFIIEE